MEPLDVALPSAETSPDKTNKPLGLASCGRERKPRRIKDPAVTPFRAAQLAASLDPGRAPTGPRHEASERLAGNSWLSDTCSCQEWAGPTTRSRRGGSSSWIPDQNLEGRSGSMGRVIREHFLQKSGRAKIGKGQRSSRVSSPDLSYITCKLEPTRFLPGPLRGKIERRAGTVLLARGSGCSREDRTREGVCPNTLTPIGQRPFPHPGPWVSGCRSLDLSAPPTPRPAEDLSLEGGAVSAPRRLATPRPAGPPLPARDRKSGV